MMLQIPLRIWLQAVCACFCCGCEIVNPLRLSERSLYGTPSYETHLGDLTRLSTMWMSAMAAALRLPSVTQRAIWLGTRSPLCQPLQESSFAGLTRSLRRIRHSQVLLVQSSFPPKTSGFDDKICCCESGKAARAVHIVYVHIYSFVYIYTYD